MTRGVMIASRFRGPSTSGNGGYVCGLVAAALDGPAEVNLRRPPPLERPLALDRLDDETVRLVDGEDVVADARRTVADVARIPEPVSWGVANEAARGYRFFRDHAFPECFVCGPHRDPGDGLRIFPGRVPGSDVVAAPWRPDPEWAGPDGDVRPEIVWAALDCPGGIAIGGPLLERPAVLARLAATLTAPVRPGRDHVVLGWVESRESRKYVTGSAVFDADGVLCGHATALWVRLRSHPVPPDAVRDPSAGMDNSPSAAEVSGRTQEKTQVPRRRKSISRLRGAPGGDG